MLRGLYAANTAMLVQQAHEMVISQNLANLNTVGYKADAVVLGTLSGASQTAHLGVAVKAVRTNHGGGPPAFTGRALDVALAGSGYLAVQGPEGEVLYTRNGLLGVNRDGFLVNQQGYLVLGDDGPLHVGSQEAVVREDGVITVGGKEVGRLRVVDFADQDALTKMGDNLFRAGEPVAAAGKRPLLQSGWLEQSNVDPVESVVGLLSALRAYEAAQRVLRAEDELLGRAIGEVGVLR